MELLTHYGREHYCTLSSLRLYGISMVDEYEAEAAVVESNLNHNNLQFNKPLASIPSEEEFTKFSEEVDKIKKDMDHIPIRKKFDFYLGYLS